jgi:hypothetical protein
MKKTILLILSTIATSSVFSEERNGFIGVSLGLSSPFGDFANTNNKYGKVGYATLGANFNINFNYRLNDWFGLSISCLGSANGVNSDKIITSPTVNYRVTINKPSTIGCFLIGAFVKKNSFPIFGKAQIGYSLVKTADITITQNNLPFYHMYDSELGSNYGFAFCLGTGAIFNIGKRVACNISVDYLNSLAKPNYTLVDDYFQQILGSSQVDYYHHYINTQIGIGYTFN